MALIEFEATRGNGERLKIAAFAEGGLAVHPPIWPNWKFMIRSQWAISHIGSGLTLGFRLGRLAEACATARFLSDRYGVQGSETGPELKGRVGLRAEVKKLRQNGLLLDRPQFVSLEGSSVDDGGYPQVGTQEVLRV